MSEVFKAFDLIVLLIPTKTPKLVMNPAGVSFEIERDMYSLMISFAKNIM